MFSLEINSFNNFILVEIPKKNASSSDDYTIVKYEVFGDKKYFNAGLIESVGDTPIYFSFKTDDLEDNIYFIKVSCKKQNGDNDLYVSFFDYEKYKVKENLKMKIVDTQPTFVNLIHTIGSENEEENNSHSDSAPDYDDDTESNY